MKKNILTQLLIFFCVSSLLAQDKVLFIQNFEMSEHLPSELGDLAIVNVLNPSDDKSSSPDYFHKKARKKDFRLPNTVQGKVFLSKENQNAIVGIITCMEGNTGYREYITIELEDVEFIEGNSYIISCLIQKSSLYKSMKGYYSEIGIFFSQKPVIQNKHYPLSLSPQCSFPVESSEADGEWIIVRDTIKNIKETYKYATIGCFLPVSRIRRQSSKDYFFLDNFIIKEIRSDTTKKEDIEQKVFICNTDISDNLMKSTQDGSGVYEFFIDLGIPSGNAELYYNMKAIPDKLIVYSGNKIIYETQNKSGQSFVKGEKRKIIHFNTKMIRVVITGNANKYTDWVCKVSCPK
jgi:hypothetical protein